MSYCLSVYFLVVFKTILRVLWTEGCLVGFKIVFWVLFVELGGLLTPSVTRLFLATSHLVKTLVASVPWIPYSFQPLSVPKSRAQIPSVQPFSLYPQPLHIRVHGHLEDNS